MKTKKFADSKGFYSLLKFYYRDKGIRPLSEAMTLASKDLAKSNYGRRNRKQ